VTLLALLAVAGLFMVNAGRSSAGAEADRAPTAQVVVQPGQTLWQVAAAAMPGTDTREAIERVRELNGLESSVLRPGQALLVPAT
jgi:LysM repeat protein